MSLESTKLQLVRETVGIILAQSLCEADHLIRLVQSSPQGPLLRCFIRRVLIMRVSYHLLTLDLSVQTIAHERFLWAFRCGRIQTVPSSMRAG